MHYEKLKNACKSGVSKLKLLANGKTLNLYKFSLYLQDKQGYNNYVKGVIIMQFNEERKFYVYVWYYKKDGKIFYVGKGTKYRYRSKKRDNPKLVEIINSCECDSKILIDGLTEKEAFEYEIIIIEILREEKHPLINILDGGYLPPNHKGKIRSEETKRKMSKSMKKHYESHPELSKAQSDKMREFLKTEKGKQFQQKSIKSRDNDDFRKTLSIICKKANNTDEYIARQSEIVKKMWKSDDYLKAHSGANNHRAQAVRQYNANHELIAEYVTMTEASKVTGVSVSKISAVARKKRKTAGGYIWEYSNEKKLNHSKTSYVYDVNKDKSALSVIQYDKNGNYITEYKSIAEATRANNFPNRTNIIQNLKGKTKSAYGYVWKYKQDNTVPSQ